MECLETDQIHDWLLRHGHVPDLGEFFTGDPWKVVEQRQYADADGERSGKEPLYAAAILAHLGRWDECLVWVRRWGTWASAADWPASPVWHGAIVQKAPLEKAPGHRFVPYERANLVLLLTMAMEFAWDAIILCALDGKMGQVGAAISHDDWFEIYRVDPAGDTGGTASIGDV
jgi:hypothetical protein